jgi:hypothetical protein
MKTVSLALGICVAVVSDFVGGAEAPVRFAIVGLAHDHARGFIPSAKSRQDVQLVAIVAWLRQNWLESAEGERD